MIPKTTIFCLIGLFACLQEAAAQIGRKQAEVQGFFSQAQLLSNRKESGYTILDYRTGAKEISAIYFNKDSVAVMLASTIKDSSYSLSDLGSIIQNNVPDFASNRKGGFGTVTCYHDSVRQCLVMFNHKDLQPKSPIQGFAIVTDPAMIAQWIKNVEVWEDQ
jgi:hypothetical protein